MGLQTGDLFGKGFGAATDERLGAIDGLQDIQVKLLSAGNPDIKTVALNGLEDPLRVNLKHLLRAFERSVIERTAIHAAEQSSFLLGQGAGGAREQRRGEQFDFREVV